MRDRWFGGPGEFAVVCCADCRCRYLYPRPKQEFIGRYYPEGYGSFTEYPLTPLRRLAVNMAELPYQARYGGKSLAVALFGGGRVLDVGCGIGSYLGEMQRIGWDVYGVDPSESAVRVARSRVGTTRVAVGTLETLDPSLSGFDLIAMNHCLEHVPFPVTTLAEVRRRLTPGGALHIAIPDVSSAEAKLFGQYWRGLEVPRHLVDYSLETLSRVLMLSGFRVERWRPQFAPSILRASLDSWIGAWLPRRQRLLSGVLNYPVMILGSLANALGNRGCIEVVARTIPYAAPGDRTGEGAGQCQ